MSQGYYIRCSNGSFRTPHDYPLELIREIGLFNEETGNPVGTDEAVEVIFFTTELTVKEALKKLGISLPDDDTPPPPFDVPETQLDVIEEYMIQANEGLNEVKARLLSIQDMLQAVDRRTSRIMNKMIKNG